jgi:UDP-glucuronate decarboxylase
MHPNDGRVVSNFIIQALRGDPITIYGDGQQTRSFCYVDDLIEGFISMMNANDDVSGPINMGNPQESSIKELAERIIKLTASKSELIKKDLPQDDPLQRQPDITLAKRHLGWQPAIDLETGLTKTIDYFRAFV